MYQGIRLVVWLTGITAAILFNSTASWIALVVAFFPVAFELGCWTGRRRMHEFFDNFVGVSTVLSLGLLAWRIAGLLGLERFPSMLEVLIPAYYGVIYMFSFELGCSHNTGAQTT